jgi:predicted nucleotidyltransferase
MNFGLSEEALESIRGVLARYPAVEEAVVFGSRSLGRELPCSDVDIALRGEVSPLEAESIALELDDLPLPFHFDVQAMATIRHGGLRAHIARAGQTVYHKAAPAAAGRD